MRKSELFFLAIISVGITYKAGTMGMRDAAAVPTAAVLWQDILNEPEYEVYFDPLKEQRLSVRRALEQQEADAVEQVQTLAKLGDVWAHRLLAAGFDDRPL